MQKQKTKPLVHIELDRDEVGQVLDGLEIRAQSWEQTAEYLRAGQMPVGEVFLIEECSDGERATQIAERYRDTIQKIRTQTNRPG